MNKQELVAQVSRRTNVSRKVADAVISGLLDTIAEALSQRDRVTIAGFGTFDIKVRGERGGRNPRTGEAIVIEARQVVTFAAGKGLKDRLEATE